MSTSPSTTSLELSPEIFSDPEVKIKEYTALAPYVWETRQIEILDHYLPLYKMNKTVGQHMALLDKSFWKMKAKRYLALSLPAPPADNNVRGSDRYFGGNGRVRSGSEC